MVVLVTSVMLKHMPTEVKLPYQALVDDGLLGEERLTLAILYAHADEDGLVDETPRTLSVPRSLHQNSVRRHIYKLAELNYLIPLEKATRLEHIPQRRQSRGFALTLKADGQRYNAAAPSKRVGSRNWARKARWS